MGPYNYELSEGDEQGLHTSPRHNGQILFHQVNSNLIMSINFGKTVTLFSRDESTNLNNIM